MVIVSIFAEKLFASNLSLLVAGLFVASLVALIGGLSCFLREVYLATQGIQIETARFERHVGDARSGGGSRASEPEAATR